MIGIPRRMTPAEAALHALKHGKESADTVWADREREQNFANARRRASWAIRFRLRESSSSCGPLSRDEA